MIEALKYIRFDERGKPEPKIIPYLNPAIEKNLKKIKKILQKEIAKMYAIKKFKKEKNNEKDTDTIQKKI